MSHMSAEVNLEAISLANRAFWNKEWSTAAVHYWELAKKHPSHVSMFELNLELLRDYWLEHQQERLNKGETPLVAVSCWSFGHNPAGRSVTLYEGWKNIQPNVELIGSYFTDFGCELWSPLQHMDIPYHSFVCEYEESFLDNAVSLVLRHPYDLVHISKPRMASIVFARLYQLIWGAKVILDIDDEELSFTDTEELQSDARPKALVDLRKSEWTHWAVNQVSTYPLRTTSNPALDARYSGAVLPHVRPLSRFTYDDWRRKQARDAFEIPQNAKVFVFAGTPRKHKGLLKAAKALAEFNDSNIWFLVAGDFPKSELKLKTELERMNNLNVRFLPNQPYDKINDVLIAADVAMLLQEKHSLVTDFQLPAKLMDALGMGLLVLATPTPSIQHLVDDGVVKAVHDITLHQSLRRLLKGWGDEEFKRQSGMNRQYFKEHLSVESIEHTLKSLLEHAFNSQEQTHPDWSGKLELLINDPYHFLIPRQ